MSHISFDREGPVGVLTLNRQEKLNALTREMYAEIAEVLRELDGDPSLLVGVVHGAGERAFSAGADLDQEDNRRAEAWRWQPQRRTGFDTGLEVQVPVIAAIEGYCMGGGLELALACDIRVASQAAQFGAPEVRWALLCGYGGVALAAEVGLANAMYVLLSGKRISAPDAYRMGLIQEIADPGAAFQRAMELASEIAAAGPMAVRMTKELVRSSWRARFDASLRLSKEYYRLLDASDDIREGARAFAERRPANFTGT